MRYRRADAIGPGAAISGSLCGERRAAELLRVKPERMLLRRILALRQSTGDCLGGKFVSKAGLIPDLIGHAFYLLQPILHGTVLRLVHRFVDLIETADRKQELMQLIHLYRSIEHLVQ